METTDLTASFGWSSNEAYDQHDVQELCRLMFDALEHRWKGSDHDKLIQNLYRGTMQDFVRCLTCGRENVRQDYFLDLPLALKPFGAMEAYKSVEEALQAFVTPERLDGSNQYYCESCASKQNADKGLRVTQFPYMLTIQLKRFDFDYNTMHRIKLNDKMTFPDILNLNPFIYAPDSPEMNTVNEAEVLYCGMPVVGEPLRKEEVQRLVRQGPYVYELFSVMVHQGSAAGGHYYAYIKNMDQDRWYCFNDSRVDFAHANEIEKSFGGSIGGWSNSNTNAYMLMYRQYDPSRNMKFIRTPELPKHIVQLQNHWRRLEEEKEREREYQQSLIYVTVELNFPCESEDLVSSQFKTQIPRTNTVGEIFNMAFKHFEDKAKEKNITIFKNNARLVRTVSGSYSMLAEYVSKRDFETKLEECFTQMEKQHDYKELLFLLDVKKNNRFLINPREKPRTIAVSRVDIAKRTVWPPFRVNLLPQHEKVLLAKQVIGAALGDDQRAMIESRLVLQLGDNSSRRLKLLDQNMAPIAEVLRDCFMQVPLLFYDGGEQNTETDEDREKKPEESAMFEILDRKKFAMILRIRKPDHADIQHAAMLRNAFAGPSWRDMVATVAADPSPQAAAPSSSGLQNEMINENAEMMQCGSGRSTPSSISDNEMMTGTNSLCNNTPQMSPTVSDPDEGFSDERTINQSKRAVGSWNLLEECGGNKTWANIVAGRLAESANNTYDATMSEVGTATQSTADSGSTIVPAPVDCGKNIKSLGKGEYGLHLYDMDSRISVGNLKTWLGRELNVDSDQMVLVIHHNDDIGDRGFDTCARDEDSIASAFSSIHWLEVKLRPPLKDEEKLIRVMRFDAEDPNKDNWKMLFEVPASRHTLVGDFLLQCHRLYQEIICDEIDFRQIRLRDMSISSRPALDPEATFEKARSISSWNNAIYFQVVTDERLIGKPGEPIFVRKFLPSTVEVGPIHEVLVNFHAQNGFDELLRAISEYSGIPLEFVQITEPPQSQWEFGKWPYLKPRLDMLDGTSIRFVSTRPAGLPVDFLSRVGCRVIYYKDSREKAKELTEEERKQITIKDNTTSSNSTVQRRKERPLRIQMSSISES